MSKLDAQVLRRRCAARKGHRSNLTDQRVLRERLRVGYPTKSIYTLPPSGILKPLTQPNGTPSQSGKAQSVVDLCPKPRRVVLPPCRRLHKRDNIKRRRHNGLLPGDKTTSMWQPPARHHGVRTKKKSQNQKERGAQRQQKIKNLVLVTSCSRRAISPCDFTHVVPAGVIWSQMECTNAPSRADGVPGRGWGRCRCGVRPDVQHIRADPLIFARRGSTRRTWERC